MKTKLTKVEKESLSLELIYELSELTGESISSLFKWLNIALPEKLPFSRATAFNNMKREILNGKTADRELKLNKMESEWRLRSFQIPTNFKREGYRLMTFLCYYDVKTHLLIVEYGSDLTPIEDIPTEMNTASLMTRKDLKGTITHLQEKIGLPFSSILLTNQLIKLNADTSIYYGLEREKFFKKPTRFKTDTKIAVTPKNRFQIRVEQQNKCEVAQIFPEIEKVTFNLSENGFIKLLQNAVQKHNSSVAFPKFKKRKEAIYEAKIKENRFSQRTRLYGLKIQDIMPFTGTLPTILYDADDDE